MAIELLSTRLANQIAAGEVVERPASVIKELVENSLDAGATKIQIDVEKGGSRLLRVRDNGCGVAKDQLMLALSRHATSKIKSLDDLEAIVSLGFRGEALASVSSVSRLTFASKTEQQHEAWQAFAQGRDMSVEITPVAHPLGTTVEVADLFFNTPARRRFLRTEKTEFNHIDELVKRFALSRFDVEFVLKHNDKLLRNLKVAATPAQKERRVAAICSNRFMESAIAISFNDDGQAHNDVKLTGWLGLPQIAKSHSDVQYCYVNGRMMRDKLINHAIRQAYQPYIPEGMVPSYVLYIELDPGQVDVNVHPAKHEVRFHQSRIIHDLIIQVLGNALSQGTAGTEFSLPDQPVASTHHYHHDNEPSAASGVIAESRAKAPGQEFYQQTNASGSGGYQSSYLGGHHQKPNIAVAAQSYQQLMTQPVELGEQPSDIFNAQATVNQLLGQPLTILEQQYLTVLHQQQIKIVSLYRLGELVNQHELMARWSQGFVGQPLLLPIAIPLDRLLLEQLGQYKQIFRRLGIDFSLRDPQIIVKQVPKILRDKDIVALIPQLLQLLDGQQHLDEHQLQPIVCQWLAKQVGPCHSLEQATVLLQRAAEFNDVIEHNIGSLMITADFEAAIAAFTTD